MRLDRNVLHKLRLGGGAPAYRQALNLAWYRAGRKGHNTNESTLPGSAALGAASFTTRPSVSITILAMEEKNWGWGKGLFVIDKYLRFVLIGSSIKNMSKRNS
jgi:hypothetical protein